MKYLILCALLVACGKDLDQVPSCEFIDAEFSGDRVSFVIRSSSPSVQMCRDFGRRVECWTILAQFYGCINISASPGDVISFEDRGSFCQIVVE